ncbi:MAG: hypothetical protein DRI22_01490 [Caldiserica bacterium]|nr:MAG: hypothetical protein DRI22_01490 [Caldisericota bacterium]
MLGGLFLLMLILIELNGGIGIGTKFGTVVLEKVSPGGTYNLRQLRGVPYIVLNNGNGEIEVEIQVIPPNDPKEGYEPILDPSWLRIEPNRLKLKPGEEFPCTLILSIPDDKNLIGKHYHAYIRAQIVGEDLYGAAVVNNFFFSIGTEGPEAVKKAKAKKLLKELNFDVDPNMLFLKVKAGKVVNVFKELKKSFKILNKGRRKLKLRIKSVKNTMRYPLLEGYEFTPDINFIWAKPEIVKVKGYRIIDAKLFLKIPEEYSGKKFMFIIAVSPYEKEFSLVQLFVRVYVEVE